jgi:hypothetical protein
MNLIVSIILKRIYIDIVYNNIWKYEFDCVDTVDNYFSSIKKKDTKDLLKLSIESIPFVL